MSRPRSMCQSRRLRRREGVSFAPLRGPAEAGGVRGSRRKCLIGEMAERSKALDWNSSNIFTGVRGFESHSLRHTKGVCLQTPFVWRRRCCGRSQRVRQNRWERFWTMRSIGPEGPAARTLSAKTITKGAFGSPARLSQSHSFPSRRIRPAIWAETPDVVEPYPHASRSIVWTKPGRRTAGDREECTATGRVSALPWPIATENGWLT